MNYYIRLNTGQYMGYGGKPSGLTKDGKDRRYPYSSENHAKRALRRYSRLYPDWMAGATVDRASW